jgi:hypothetical protein
MGNENGTDFDISTIMSPDGTFTDQFNQHATTVLGDEFKEFKGFEKYKNMNELLKGSANAIRKVGEKVVVPDKDAAPEQMAAYYKAIGVPESADKYAIARPDQLPDGMHYNEDFEKAFRQVAFESKMPQSMVEALAGWFNQMQIDEYNGQIKANDEARTAGETALRKDWPGTKYDENSAIAQEAFKKLFPETFVEKLRAANLLNDPDVLKAGYDMGIKMISDTAKSSDPQQDLKNELTTMYNRSPELTGAGR